MPHVDSHPVTVQPRGDLDLDALETMVHHLSHVTRLTDEIVIDLREVTYLDSTAVRVLAHAMSRGATLIVDDASDEVTRFVQTSGLLEPAY
jgi:anti-anti-sigma factor